jgi:hypothetical protein
MANDQDIQLEIQRQQLEQIKKLPPEIAKQLRKEMGLR